MKRQIERSAQARGYRRPVVRAEQDARGAERRNEQRVAAAVRVTWETAHDFYAGITGDVSYGGVFIATEAPPEPGTDLAVTITLPDGEQVRAQGRVRWIRTPDLAGPQHPAGCGVAWSAEDLGSVRAVQRFVDASGSNFIAQVQ